MSDFFIYFNIKDLALKDVNINFEKSTFDINLNIIDVPLFLNREIFKGKYCNSNNIKVRGSKTSRYVHGTTQFKNVNIKLNARVFKCNNCSKTFKEDINLSSGKGTISLSKELEILNSLKNLSLTYSDIAFEYNVSTTTVQNIFDKYVSLSRYTLPMVLSIDEVYFKKLTKKKYCLVMYDPINNKLIDILPSRIKGDLLRYFNRIPREEKKRVKNVVIDMWDTYYDLARRVFPTALIAVDSFHVIKTLSECFKKIRISIMKRYEHLKYDNDQNYWLLKKFNYYLNKDLGKLPEYKFFTRFNQNLSKYQVVEYMLELDDKLRLAYELKEEYRNFNYKATTINADEWLSELIIKFQESNIEEYKPFYRLLERWKKEIVNSFIKINHYRLSNAKIERFNLKIKNYKNLSFGLRNFEQTRNRIMFSCNEDSTIKG